MSPTKVSEMYSKMGVWNKRSFYITCLEVFASQRFEVFLLSLFALVLEVQLLICLNFPSLHVNKANSCWENYSIFIKFPLPVHKYVLSSETSSCPTIYYETVEVSPHPTTLCYLSPFLSLHSRNIFQLHQIQNLCKNMLVQKPELRKEAFTNKEMTKTFVK